MQVKICGIRRIEDALMAAELGADAVGLLVGQRHQSADFISSALAREIKQALPPSVGVVLVTHVTDVDELDEILQATGITTIQLHSEITPAAVGRLRARGDWLKIIKSVHVISGESVRYPEPFRALVDGLVLDTLNLATNQVGGTGNVHDWSISREIVARFPELPIFLAGGLNAENVRAAIDYVHPIGVDVNSGTKGIDGFKDRGRMLAFIQEAKR